MKAIRIIVAIVILVSFEIKFAGCSKEEVLTPNQQTEQLLSKQLWELTAVTIDDVSSDLYSGLTISFNSTTYTSLNGGAIWPASGTWSFLGEKGDKILRDDGLEITIETINASQLVINFIWTKTTSIGGRIYSLKGLHRMTFKRKV
jgi:hypothetical protein